MNGIRVWFDTISFGARYLIISLFSIKVVRLTNLFSVNDMIGAVLLRHVHSYISIKSYSSNIFFI